MLYIKPRQNTEELQLKLKEQVAKPEHFSLPIHLEQRNSHKLMKLPLAPTLSLVAGIATANLIVPTALYRRNGVNSTEAAYCANLFNLG